MALVEIVLDLHLHHGADAGKGVDHRSDRLIELGALVVMSGMDQDRGLVLGALMEVADQLRQPGSESVANRYKNRGDARLAEQEQLAKKLRLRKLTDVA
jgi:hypothetical protein